MKIGFFVWEYPPCLVGGLGAYARDVTRVMVRKIHRVSVFTLNPRRQKKCVYCERKNICELPTYEVIHGVEIHRPLIFDASDALLSISEELKKWGDAAMLFNDIFSYNVLSASKLINHLIFEEKYDLVCAHDWLSAIAGLIIKRDTEIPVVFHVHSTEELRANLSQMIKNLEHKMAERANRVITVSYAMKQHLEEIGYPADKIDVVWNGIDTQTFSPEKVDTTLVEKWKEKYSLNDEKVVLFVGRLTRIKGVENLLKAFPYVLEEFPNTKLIIIGKGEEYAHLLEISDKLGIKEKVFIISQWLRISDLVANYALADVCVFPSLAEPFGIVSLEAMAMEKPVVVGAHGVSGFREQVIPSGPEQCGIHINPYDTKDIAHAIKECLRDEKRAKKWGKNGRKRVLKEFTIEKTVEKTLKIYKNVINE